MNTGDNQSSQTDEQKHWACGKVNCDCDEQYEALRDQELMAEETRDREHEIEESYYYD